jgi:cyclopropane fatty-acyl-phospholipid synthase-like methyltransferase
MNDRINVGATVPGENASTAQAYNFWSEANLKFNVPHYRMRKTARIVKRLAGERESDLLDLGCGPGTLATLLPENIRYHGMDIAIHQPAPNLIQADLRATPIRFGDQQFDIVVAQGVFEYLGSSQLEKFDEISKILRADGRFLVSYWNFNHRNAYVYHAFSNVQPLAEFRNDLAKFFTIERFFPASHNWRHTGPNRRITRAINMPIELCIPLVSPLLAVEYFFICAPRG